MHAFFTAQAENRILNGEVLNRNWVHRPKANSHKFNEVIKKLASLGKFTFFGHSIPARFDSSRNGRKGRNSYSHSFLIPISETLIGWKPSSFAGELSESR